jgi:hypothetical protein
MAGKKGGRKKSRKQAKWHLTGKKVSLARKRGHKPVRLLELYRDRMATNLDRLDSLIKRRHAAGE